MEGEDINLNYSNMLEASLPEASDQVNEPSIPGILHVLSVASLLSNDPAVEQGLQQLTHTQLNSIEKLVNKVKGGKKRKLVHKSICTEQRSPSRITNSPKLNEDVNREEDLRREQFQLPTTHMDNDVEYMTFYYSSKGTDTKYTIRIDIEQTHPPYSDQFQIINTLYPRAFCDKSNYKGNRWDYETMCNDLGWRLAYLNEKLLGGRRGLLQRAVDSYRNRQPGLQSRRVARQEKLLNGTLRKKIIETKPIKQNEDQKEMNLNQNNLIELDQQLLHQALTQLSLPPPLPKDATLTITVYPHGHAQQLIINANTESNTIPMTFSNQFQLRNSVYPRALNSSCKPRRKLELEKHLNLLGYKLAYLNNVLDGNVYFLQIALDQYRKQFTIFTVRPYRV